MQPPTMSLIVVAFEGDTSFCTGGLYDGSWNRFEKHDSVYVWRFCPVDGFEYEDWIPRTHGFLNGGTVSTWN
tara:strand:+ start:366 stop:581 length:216 start_codon:yes stop_codon:yes gene_type:complete